MKTKKDRIKQKIQAKPKRRFIRQESWRYARLRTTWRKAKGIEQTMRIYHNSVSAGVPRNPSVGYRTPNEIRGVHPSGYEMIVVHNIAELEPLKPKYHAIMIASSVGRKKRIALKDAILTKGFKLLNPGIKAEVEEFGKEIETGLGDVDQTVGKVEDIKLTDEDLDDIDKDVDDKKDDKEE